jgi:ribosomal protein S27E
MSSELCLSCGEMVPAENVRCENCGAAVVRSRAPNSGGGAGIHPMAPVVFVVAALAIGGAGTLAVSLALGIPLGLMGGGIGVWMLERGRRLR